MKKESITPAAKLKAGLDFAADKLAEETIGRHVLLLLAARKRLSARALLVSLETEAGALVGARKLVVERAISRLRAACEPSHP
jgi:hypothetical protein